MQRSCPGCGARLSEDAELCDLCGTSTTDISPEYNQDSAILVDPTVPADIERQARAPLQNERMYCNQCGAPNPAQSNFCSSCGEKIAFVETVIGKPDTAATANAADSPDTILAPPALGGAAESSYPVGEPGAARQVGILVGAGLLIILVWYIGSIVLSDRSTSPAPTNSGQLGIAPDSGPLPDQFLEQEQSLQAELSSLSGIAQDTKRRELVDLYVAANRLDRAAAEAERIAEAEGSEQMWVATANLYYDWMETRSPAERAIYAKKSIAAYQKALEINPENLDARTDMAIAYMYDPQNPMLAIQETMKVLESDSLHINANFNRGVMLLQINRIDQAIDQLQKVKRIVGDPTSPVYIQAEQLIEDTLGQPTN
jgi:tetratricopeptide (TPR) repeat protein/ribosomal protein L40E